MNSSLTRQLDSLVRRQRRRRWRRQVVAGLRPGLYYSAGVFFLAGVIHQQLWPLNSLSIIAFALLPPVFLLLWLFVKKKPGLDQAAAEADELTGARALLVTGWELTHRQTPMAGAAMLLLKRCEAALPGWTKKLRTPSRQTLKPASLLALSLGLAGVFFLWLPSPTTPSSPTSSPTAISGSAINRPQAEQAGKLIPAEPNQKPDTTAQALSALFQPAAAPQPQDDVAAFAGKPPGLASTPPGEKKPPVLPDSKAPAPASPLNADDHTQQAGLSASSKTPASAAGSEAGNNNTSAVEKGNAFTQIERIGIHISTDPQTGANASGDTGKKLIASSAEPSNMQSSALSISSGTLQAGANSRLNATQRALVRRYFNQREKQHHE
ncbi:MAG TPA: hypothetical protein ENJ64_06205 [Thiotrichales bacterium]|nr:hypothetical protein [Thiotrichales bacterium]